jgi:hypothetical protein
LTQTWWVLLSAFLGLVMDCWLIYMGVWRGHKWALGVLLLGLAFLSLSDKLQTEVLKRKGVL